MITIDQLQLKTYALFLLDLVIGLVDTVKIFKVQLHQPVYFLMVILYVFIDEPLSLNAFAVLHQRSNDRNYVLCTLHEANLALTTDYIHLQIHIQMQASSEQITKQCTCIIILHFSEATV